MIRRFSLFTSAILCGTIPTLRADISFIDIFNNTVYQQTSGAAPTTPSGYFFNVELTSQNPGDFGGVSVTYPGPGSPLTLPMVSSTFFGFGSPVFSTLGAEQAAYPFGSYVYTATGAGAPTQTATFEYTQDNFTADIPALDPASFAALNGLAPNTALTIDFDSFTPNPSATQGLGFFTIFGAGGAVFADGFLPPGTTSLTIPGGTLLPSTTYGFELDFSDRTDGADANGVPTLLGSDVRTDGTFTTGPNSAVPEPGSIALLLSVAALATTFAGRRFRRVTHRSSERSLS